MTTRIAIRPAQQWLQWRPRRRPCRHQHLGVLRESLIALPRLLEGVSADRLHRSPAPGEWSAHVVVCHLALDEMNTTMILRLILTQECPSLVAIDADNVLCEARFALLCPDTCPSP
jgi:hypothetical protein